MSNISLGGNNGNSINFDVAALQNQQEDEYRKEEEQQQNELRALLTNAFDDLIDDDDILSITSDDGTDSRNVSLVRRHSNDSLGPPVQDEKNSESPEPKPNTNWTKFINTAGPQSRQLNPRQVPQSRYGGAFEPLSRTQEFSRGQMDLLRASVESMPSFPSTQNSRETRSRDSHSLRGSHDLLDDDFHSNTDEQPNVDFHGNVYPLNSLQGQHDSGQVQGQFEGQQNHQNVLVDRDNVLRKSIEDFTKFKEAYQNPEHYYGHLGNLDHMQTHQQHYHAAEQPYDQGQGHYYHHHDHQVGHHGYEGHYPDAHHPDAHHHFRNIYQDRPYHQIGEREETEGGNAGQQMDELQYYHHGYGRVQGHLGHGHGYQGDDIAHNGTETGNVNNNYGHDYGSDRLVHDGYAPSSEKIGNVRTGHSNQTVQGAGSSQTGSGNGRKLPQVTYRFQNASKDTPEKPRNVHSKKTADKDGGDVRKKDKTELFSEKVKYDKEKTRDNVSEKEESTVNMDKEFMDQGGNGDSQQLAQLQILYKARGRKIEDLNNEIELVKNDTGREIRILKHQLSVAKGEKEGSSKSLDSVQSLLREAKNDNAQLVGRVHACESQIEGLLKTKEELINKLKTSESTIETLHQHLEELGSSDTLTRAKHDHEVVVGSLQKKYETEIKHLQENNEKLKTALQEKNSEITTLKLKLTESLKNSETAQISRAETINRLTQSLEESQKRCRNLLEASSSQEMSQMKIHLQQALASKSISDEMCSSLQEEIQDLKEQVQMLESASNLGVTTVTSHTSSNSNFVDQNDSMADLGIKKTLDFDTPQGTPTLTRNQSVLTNDVVASLKAELERCLVSNKQKRVEVTELKEEIRKVKKEMLEYKQRYDRADILTQEQKKRIKDLESCMSPGEKTNAVENRLRKDIENLKREKKVLLEDIEELQQRLDEVSKSEERLSELNRELSKQISDMVKEYDEDKREAVERAHRASEQVAETSRNKLRQELTNLFDAERSEILDKYEKQCGDLREELKIAQIEIDRVKEEYVKLCEEKESLKLDLNNEWKQKLDTAVTEVKETMKRESDLSIEEVRENLNSDKEEEITKLKEKLYAEFDMEKEKLKESVRLESEKEHKVVVERLQTEHNADLKAERTRFENELKTLRDMSEMEKNNDLAKLDKEKVNEIEKLKNVIIDKELFISEKEQIFREKENLLSEKMQILNTLKAEYKANMDDFQAEMRENSERIEELEKECKEKSDELSDKNNEINDLETKLVSLETHSVKQSNQIDVLQKELNDKSKSVEQESNKQILSVENEKKEIAEKLTKMEKEVKNKSDSIDQLEKELCDKAKQLEQLVSSLEEKDNIVEQLKENIQTLEEKMNHLEMLKQNVEKELDSVKSQFEIKGKELEVLRSESGVNSEAVLKEKIDEINKLKKEIEKLESGKESEINRLRREIESEKDRDIAKLRKELEKLESEKDVEFDKWRKEETERHEVEQLRKEIDKNIKKDRQSELESLKREVIRLKLEIDRMDSNKQMEVDKMCRIKQAEIDNLEKRKKIEFERLRKEKQSEIDRITKEKDEEISRLRRSPNRRGGDHSDATEKLRDKLNRDLEEDMKKTIETKVAMSKVMWLEEHRATRQAAIDNAVRLAETEMRLKMEDEVESKLEARLEEAKILWQSDSMSQLEEERRNWDTVKDEEISSRLENERETWRQTELETERQKWLREMEVRLEEEKESWREFELETEKLKWTSDWEQKIVREKDSWIKNILEPAKRKWKMEAEENLRLEKENWRCTELETEKLNLMREYEQRLSQEKLTLTDKALPAALERERKRWNVELEDKLKKEKEAWRNSELTRELDREKERLYHELEGRFREERNNWKNCDLPEEIEKERKKWMKLMEQTLIKEKENWKNRDLPVEVKKVREDLEQSVEKEVETRLVQKLEVEKEKLQQESESKVLEAIEEHQEACKEELKLAIEAEKERMKEKFDLEIQEHFQTEKKVWQAMVDQELKEKLEIEKEKWKRKSDSDFNKKIDIEKDKIKSWLRGDFEKRFENERQELQADFEKRVEEERERLRDELEQRINEERKGLKGDIDKRLEDETKQLQADFEKRLENERKSIEAEFEKRFEDDKRILREDMEEDFDNHMKVELDKIREKYDREAREDFEHLKAKFELERDSEFERLRMQLENETQMNIEKEKEIMQMKSDRELSRKLETEEETWRSRFEKELGEKLQKEEEKWKVMIENDIEARLKEEKAKWEEDKENEIEKKLADVRAKWIDEKEEEIADVTKKVQDNMRADLDVEIEKLKENVEQEFHMRIEHEVDLAVQDAREDWNREYMMKMSINTTSAEASQGLLKEEIGRLKHDLEKLRSEYIDKEETWLKDREDILLQKDLEKRSALETLQQQTEKEYKQFLDEHKDMLDKALKSAREQHKIDMNELEERYKTQIKILQAREKSLQEQLREISQNLLKHQELLSELEKDKVVWYDERETLLQEISDRDSLLGKADVHLSKEVDKLRSELQAAYQRRLETEMNSWRQKMDSEYARANNSEQKEKLQLEKQLSEVNTELNKQRNLFKDEQEKHSEEIKSIRTKMTEVEKRLHDHDRLEGELKKAKELLKGYKDELTDNQSKYQKLKNENEDVVTKLNRSIQIQDKIQAELQKLKEEKSSNIESVQSIEAAYRKDVSMYKQKLEDANNRIIKTEKLLQDMKQKYRSELESLRKALEVENDVAMNGMKNKMIELQKKHVAIVDEMKRKHQLDREELLKHGHSAALRGITPTANMGEVEDIDVTVKELRSQYLDTVAKIKDDVLRHITQTNVRAAETVKIEMDKERMTTFQQIKDFYRSNVKQILETEIVGATLESKLLAVEEALENLSSNPSSRSATPSDEYVLDDRSMKSRSRSASRDAGISPKGQRSVSFTSGTKGERSRTPVNSGKDLSMSSQFDDPRSPKNRHLTKSPRDIHVTVRGERSTDIPELRNTKDWKYEALKDSSFDTRDPENRPTSARLAREMRDNDTRSSENRPLSAKSPREIHMSLRQRNSDTDYTEGEGSRERNRSGDKKKGRTLISTRDIHSGRYNKGPDGGDMSSDANGHVTGYYGDQRAKSTTPMYSSMSRSSPSLYRPTSVPDLSGEDKELKLWTETNNDTYRYTPLRETLKLGTNLHRNNSKSESDLSIAEKHFGQLKPEYDSNLDLSTGSLSSDMFLTPRKRDAGETPTPTSTPRRHFHRKHYTLHSFPTRDQLSSELRNRDQTANDSSNDLLNTSRSEDVGVNSPMSRSSRKNLPLIQFRHGKVQTLARGHGTSVKSPHPEEGVIIRDTPPTRDTTGTPERNYRPLSVSSNAQLDF